MTAMQKGVEGLEMEDRDETEGSEKWKQRCISNDFGCCVVPQLPDGYER